MTGFYMFLSQLSTWLSLVSKCKQASVCIWPKNVYLHVEWKLEATGFLNFMGWRKGTKVLTPISNYYIWHFLGRNNGQWSMVAVESIKFSRHCLYALNLEGSKPGGLHNAMGSSAKWNKNWKFIACAPLTHHDLLQTTSGLPGLCSLTASLPNPV